MQRNVGPTDQRIRYLIGAVALVASMATVAFGESLGQTTQIALAAVLLVAAAIMFLTGVSQTCPIYAILGLDSSGK